jgi:hypothetical protein
MDAVVKELIDLLDECGIEHYKLDTTRKQLTIEYKEDFDRFFPKFDAKPMKLDSQKDKFLPYGWDHYAFFDYKEWRIEGNIIRKKNN